VRLLQAVVSHVSMVAAPQNQMSANVRPIGRALNAIRSSAPVIIVPRLAVRVRMAQIRVYAILATQDLSAQSGSVTGVAMVLVNSVMD